MSPDPVAAHARKLRKDREIVRFLRNNTKKGKGWPDIGHLALLAKKRGMFARSTRPGDIEASLLRRWMRRGDIESAASTAVLIRSGLIKTNII